MKKSLGILFLSFVMFTIGCATQSRSYFIEARIYPLSVEEIEKMKEVESADDESKANFSKEIYNCELQISEIMEEGKESETKNVICAPKLTFYKGQKANVTISDDKGTSGVTADVLVDDTNGTNVTNLDVKIKEKGKTVSHSKMEIGTPSK